MISLEDFINEEFDGNISLFACVQGVSRGSVYNMLRRGKHYVNPDGQLVKLLFDVRELAYYRASKDLS